MFVVTFLCSSASHSAVRFDPATLLVDISDYTYSATLEGESWANFKRVPYGVSADCSVGGFSYATIDLRGTPFKVAEDCDVIYFYFIISYLLLLRFLEIFVYQFFGFFSKKKKIVLSLIVD